MYQTGPAVCSVIMAVHGVLADNLRSAAPSTDAPTPRSRDSVRGGPADAAPAARARCPQSRSMNMGGNVRHGCGPGVSGRVCVPFRHSTTSRSMVSLHRDQRNKSPNSHSHGRTPLSRMYLAIMDAPLYHTDAPHCHRRTFKAACDCIRAAQCGHTSFSSMAWTSMGVASHCMGAPRGRARVVQMV